MTPPTSGRQRGVLLVFFLATLAAAGWRAAPPQPPAFAPPPTTPAPTLPAMFTSEQLPATGQPAAASLTQLLDGRLAAAWVADGPTDDASRDIYFSIRQATGWSTPQPIASRESTAAGTFAHLQEIGNPLLYAEGGWLHLWYTSRRNGAGDALLHSLSTTGGKRWTPAETLPGAPPFAALRLAAAPLALVDGGFGLSVSSDRALPHSAYLRLAPNGRILEKQRWAPAARQATSVVLDEHHALTVLGDSANDNAPNRLMSTADGGQTWQAGPPLPAGAPLALLRLSSGHVLLASRPLNSTGLALYLSTDAGRTWQWRRRLPPTPGGAYRDPALLLDRDGSIHLVHGAAQGLHLLSFSEAWLTGETP